MQRKGPFLARSSRYAFPKGDLRGFSDTWRAKLATDCRPGMHGTHILPPSDARERIARAFCHRRALENASRENIAMARHLGAPSADAPPVPSHGIAARGVGAHPLVASAPQCRTLPPSGSRRAAGNGVSAYRSAPAAYRSDAVAVARCGRVACWFCAASTAIVQRLNRLRLLLVAIRGFRLVDDP